MDIFKFNLGDFVEDIITGYKGIIVCRTQYLTGCRKYGIASLGSKPDDWTWMDEIQIKLLEEKKIVLLN